MIDQQTTTTQQDLLKSKKLNTFQIHTSRDGLKCLDVSVISHIRKNKDGENKDMGHKIQLEFTQDGWKTKKSIMLGGGELIDLLDLLNNKQQSITIQRQNPLKKLVIENQQTHFFVKFYQKDTNQFIHYTPISKIDALKLSIFTYECLKLNFKSKYNIDISLDEITKIYQNLKLESKSIEKKELVESK